MEVTPPLQYHFYCYVPKSHLEKVKAALFNAGAGIINNYSRCSWQTLGTGQYKPNKDATPFIGSTEKISYEDEYKVEMICLQTNIKEIISALKKNHPYEEPAYGIIKLETFN